MSSLSSTLGKVYLVGAGPGASDLITVRGAALLAKADVVFHDALVEEAMLAYCPQAEKIAVGKRCGNTPLHKNLSISVWWMLLTSIKWWCA